MGTWGAGAFDNDDALDWLSAFAERKSRSRVLKTLDAYEPAEGADEAALACCELAAALNGHAAPELDAQLEAWAEKERKKSPTTALVAKAVEVARVLRDRSELAARWSESSAKASWHGAIDELILRLSRTPREGPLPRRPPFVEVRQVRLPIDAKLAERLRQTSPREMIFFNVSQELTEDEWSLLVTALEKLDARQVRLVDFPKLSRGARDSKLFARFAHVSSLALCSDFYEKGVEGLRDLTGAERLQVDFFSSPAIGGGRALAALPRLRKLGVSASTSSLFEILAALSSSPLEALSASAKRPDEMEYAGTFPSGLRALQLDRLAFRLAQLSSLQELVVFSASGGACRDSHLDLSALPKLRSVRLSGLGGVELVSLPAGLRSLYLFYSQHPPSPHVLPAPVTLPYPRLNETRFSELRHLAVPAEMLVTFGEVPSTLPHLRSLQLNGGAPELVREFFRRGSPLRRLERLTLDVRSWEDLNVVERLPALKFLTVTIVDPTARWSPEALAPLRAHPSLRAVELRTLGSDADEARELLAKTVPPFSIVNPEVNVWFDELQTEISGSEALASDVSLF